MEEHPVIAALPPEERARWEADKELFCTPPDWAEADDETILADVRRRNAILRRWQMVFAAMGVDVEAIATDFEAKEEAFKHAAAEAEAATEASLQSTADLADARHRLFKVMDTIVSAAYEANPFDPQVQEAKEQLDEWRKEFPKEN